MMAFVESTETTAEVNGQLCRLWRGRNEDDAKVYLFVAYIVTEEASGLCTTGPESTPTENPQIKIGEKTLTG